MLLHAPATARPAFLCCRPLTGLCRDALQQRQGGGVSADVHLAGGDAQQGACEGPAPAGVPHHLHLVQHLGQAQGAGAGRRDGRGEPAGRRGHAGLLSYGAPPSSPPPHSTHSSTWHKLQPATLASVTAHHAAGSPPTHLPTPPPHPTPPPTHPHPPHPAPAHCHVHLAPCAGHLGGAGGVWGPHLAPLLPGHQVAGQAAAVQLVVHLHVIRAGGVGAGWQGAARERPAPSWRNMAQQARCRMEEPPPWPTCHASRRSGPQYKPLPACRSACSAACVLPLLVGLQCESIVQGRRGHGSAYLKLCLPQAG